MLPPTSQPSNTWPDPAPSASRVQATSRRGIRIDTTSFDASWLLFGPWSALITLPVPVTKLTLEVALGHAFNYAGGTPLSFGGQSRW
jgi:hypothetical protein